MIVSSLCVVYVNKFHCNLDKVTFVRTIGVMKSYKATLHLNFLLNETQHRFAHKSFVAQYKIQHIQFLHEVNFINWIKFCVVFFEKL